MSFVTDHLRYLDAYLDRQQPRGQFYTPGSRSQTISRSFSSFETSHGSPSTTSNSTNPSQTHVPKRIELVESLIKTVTAASSNQNILPLVQLRDLIQRASAEHITRISSTASLSSRSHTKSTSRSYRGYAGDGEGQDDGEEGEYGQELEWLLISKVAAQVQGHLLSRLLDEITPVLDDMYYWDGVLGSYNASALYTLQRLPSRLWTQGREAIAEAGENLAALRERGVFGNAAGDRDGEEAGGDESSAERRPQGSSAFSNFSREWRTFYGLVRESIRDRQLNDIQARLFSPVSAARMDARQRLKGLSKQKQMCAAAIGVLTNESLNPRRITAPARSGSNRGGNVSLMRSDDWKSHVASSVQLMLATIGQVSYANVEPKAYERTVLRCLDGSSGNDVESVGEIYAQLTELLVHVLPQHEEAYHEQRARFGKPSRWVRYWIPASLLLVSGSTLLRVLVNRQADITTWLRDFGRTTLAFWENWVVEPVRDVIRTIRHDRDSEIALLSRESLASDRESLERMVVDFAVENPSTVPDAEAPLTSEMVEAIRRGVREGNLTPVLRAYENDLKRPIARALMGNLVRELLIQIQKTKVDVEVAMSGIDSLLKSQELVFGFVGLTPGILVCVMVGRWLSETFFGRKGRSHGKLQSRLIRVIRNIDRILSNAEPQDHGLLSYKDHGLILCEVQVLQTNSGKVLPGDVNREFLEDVKELTDIHLGIERHIKVVDRLRWAYWKWLN